MADDAKTPVPGGGSSNLDPPDNSAKEAQDGGSVTCTYDGQTYELNDRICDGKREEWMCGSSGWFPTERKCRG